MYDCISSARILFLSAHAHEVVENGRINERYYETSEVYIHMVHEIRKLLFDTGFEILNEYGNHHKKQYEEGDEMIIFITRS